MGTSRVTAEARRCLARYRFWQRRFLAAPADPRARAAFGRAVAELCRATGERCGREAAEAAQRATPHDLAATGTFAGHSRTTGKGDIA
ncbi:DUF5133 domain-containing protein [Streptomyces sp. NPDC006422]|uniref:DUF5133 domain-containing protein n=1 Tax=unclassified Streptomyces TaxID=2593676 RepID=UPI0033A373F1